MDPWMITLLDYFTSFIDYFQAQDVPVQLLLGALVVLGCIAAGLLVYGLLWFAFQVIKASVVGIVLLVYLAGTCVGLLVMLAIDAGRVQATWTKAKHDMAWWIALAYPRKQHAPAPQAPVTGASPVAVVPGMTRGPRANVPPALNVNEPRFFCTSCGTPFSRVMTALLASKGACHCEQCGQDFRGKAIELQVA